MNTSVNAAIAVTLAGVAVAATLSPLGNRSASPHSLVSSTTASQQHGRTTATTATKTVPAITTTMVLAFPFQGGHQRVIDRGPNGLGAGDLILSTGQPILDNASGQRVGTGDSVELIVSKRHDGTVVSRGTLRLHGGHIDIDGVVRHSDSPFRVSVTGGTGIYLGTGGQLTLIKEDPARKVVIMRLELVR
jgi:hypothetical protein